MRKNMILIMTAAVLLTLFNEESVAQSNSRNVELGGQFTVIKVSERQEGAFQLPGNIDDALLGGGLRLGYNITSSFTVEAEGNIFKRPSDLEGRRSQALFGIKWGRRSDTAGIFAKVRPGFVRFDRIFSFIRSDSTNVDIKNNLYLALDVGGVIEAYPSSRSIIRFDFGDTIIRYTNRRIEGFEPGAIPILKSKYGHNFQLSAGVGFRF